jgi:hypothetical protein
VWNDCCESTQQQGRHKHLETKTMMFRFSSRTLQRSFSRIVSSDKDWEITTIGPAKSTISSWVHNYLSNSDSATRQRICSESILDLDPQVASEKLNLVSTALSSSDDGIRFGMTLRGDVLDLVAKDRRNDGLRALDHLLSQWLSAVFCLSALKLQRVTFDSSSGLLLEKIAAAEAVHKIRALSEMKNRLTNGRRCFGLFHPW